MSTFSIKEFALSEFNNEMGTTRKMLALVPFDKADWKPHQKSSPMGRLAIHVATLPGFAVDIITKDKIDFDGKYTPSVVTNTQELLKVFDDASEATYKALEATTDEELSKTWNFFVMGKSMYEGSRFGAFQSFMMNHLVHHRAQLGVYLRLNDIKIPGSYGPSADEKF